MIQREKKTMKLNGEALEYVPECIYLGQLISFRDNSRKAIRKRAGMDWSKLKSLGFILADKFLKLEIKKRPGNLRALGPVTWGPNMVTRGEGKEDGTENTACCMEQQRETNNEIRKRTKTKSIVIMADSLKCKLGGYVARMDTCCIGRDMRTGKRKTGRLKTR
jgi:hypothetical protein